MGLGYEVLSNWRACHGYPINTFQATLRQKLRTIDKNAIVAQRLKRAPSVIAKLQRFPTMKLAQMQDIGGLRAVVSSVARVRPLEASYRQSSFKHGLASSKDYIDTPKPDGYRSIHLVYRYVNHRAPAYNDLLLERQLRTRLQHAWATAVETMGTFLGQALKSGQGERPWREFFEVASAALTHVGAHSSRAWVRKLLPVRTCSLVLRRRTPTCTSSPGFVVSPSQPTGSRPREELGATIWSSSTQPTGRFLFARFRRPSRTSTGGREQRERWTARASKLMLSSELQDHFKDFEKDHDFLDTHEFVAQMERIIAEASRKGNVKRAFDRTRRTA